MTRVIKNDDGTEETLYEAGEYQALETQKAEFETKAKTLEEENAKKDAILKDKAGHIEKLKKIADMTQEEKDKLSVTELENRKAIELLQEQLADTTKQLSDKQQNEIASAREKAINAIVGTDEKLKAAFLEEYKLVNIEEKDADSVAVRVAKTAKLLGIQSSDDYTNPLLQHWDGEAPGKKDDSEAKKKEEFFTQGKGKAVMDFLGESNGTPAAKK